MMLAYLMNQYPKASHSFIRREIRELERQGWQVRRIALRRCAEPLPDQADQEETRRTRYLLGERAGGTAVRLAAAALILLARRPRRLLRATVQALRLGWRAQRPLAYHLAYLLEACQLARLLDGGGARHLHAHFGTNAAEVAMLTAMLTGLPYSFTVHGPEEFDHVAGWRLADKIHRAAFVVAVSRHGLSQLYRMLPHAAWDKVRLVRCGLESSYGPTPAPPPAPAARLVCVGRLCEQKAQLLLVEAAARLRAAGVALQLVLAGDGELREELRALIARRGLHDTVRITGWLSGAEVRAELLAARAGTAEFCGRVAGGGDGSHGIGSAGRRHIYRRRARAGNAAPERLAGAASRSGRPDTHLARRLRHAARRHRAHGWPWTRRCAAPA